MTPQEIFGRVFGVTPVEVLGDSDYYYFEQLIEDGIKNCFQVSRARVDKFAKEFKADEPVIAMTYGNVDANGFPETLLIGAAHGVDVYQTYIRDSK